MGLRPSAISFGAARGPLRALQSPACIDGVAPKREAAVAHRAQPEQRLAVLPGRLVAPGCLARSLGGQPGPNSRCFLARPASGVRRDFPAHLTARRTPVCVADGREPQNKAGDRLADDRTVGCYLHVP